MGLTQVLEVCLQRRELKNLTAALPSVGACACGAWGVLRLFGVWLRARSLCRHLLSTQFRDACGRNGAEFPLGCWGSCEFMDREGPWW